MALSVALAYFARKNGFSFISTHIHMYVYWLFKTCSFKSMYDSLFPLQLFNGCRNNIVGFSCICTDTVSCKDKVMNKSRSDWSPFCMLQVPSALLAVLLTPSKTEGGVNAYGEICMFFGSFTVSHICACGTHAPC